MKTKFSKSRPTDKLINNPQKNNSQIQKHHKSKSKCQLNSMLKAHTRSKSVITKQDIFDYYIDLLRKLELFKFSPKIQTQKNICKEFFTIETFLKNKLNKCLLLLISKNF